MREVALNNPNLVNNVFDTQGHLVLGINKVIKTGFKGVKETAIKLKQKHSPNSEYAHFLDSVVVSCDAVKRFAERFSSLAIEMAGEELDEKRRVELLRISEIMAKVPWNPPENFYEAVQFTWFVQNVSLISMGIAGIIAIGRPDQFLYDYYIRDMENGIIDQDFALELVEEEEEHVALLKQWQERYPKPVAGWDQDLDPPSVLE